jgi:hypothetical protein
MANVQVGELRVLLRVVKGEFDKGLTAAQSNLARFASGAVAGLAAMAAAALSVQQAMQSFKDVIAEDKGLLRLSFTLRQFGADAVGVSQEVERLTQQLEFYGIKQAESYNKLQRFIIATGDAQVAMDTLRTALGFAMATGADFGTVADGLAGALGGYDMRLKRLLRSLGIFVDEQESVNDLMAKMHKIAQGGEQALLPLEKASNALNKSWGDLKENIARGLAPTLTLILNFFSELALRADIARRQVAEFYAYSIIAFTEQWRALSRLPKTPLDVPDWIRGINKARVDAIKEMDKELMRLDTEWRTRQAQRQGGGLVGAAPVATGKGMKDPEAAERIKAAESAAAQRLKIEQQLTEALKRLTLDEFTYRRWAVEQQFNYFKGILGETQQLAEWHSAAMKQIATEEADHAIAEIRRTKGEEKRHHEDEIGKAGQRLTEAQQQWADQNKTQIAIVEGMANVTASTIGDVLSGLDVSMKSIGDNMRRMLANIIAQLIQMEIITRAMRAMGRPEAGGTGGSSGGTTGGAPNPPGTVGTQGFGGGGGGGVRVVLQGDAAGFLKVVESNGQFAPFAERTVAAGVHRAQAIGR